MTTTSSMVHLSSTCKQRCCFFASFAFFILYKKSPLFSYKVKKNKQMQKCIKTFMGKLSCHSGLTFQIYFQILLLSLSQATTSSAFGFHLESKWFIYLLIFGCQFQLTITIHQVQKVCMKSKIKYFILKWN